MNRSATITEKTQEVVNDLSGRATGAARDAQEMASAWAHQARAKVASLADTASDYAEQGRERAEAMGHSLEEQVRDRPWSTLAVALGIGFVIGILFMRR